MTGDIVVRLLTGTYQMAEPLTLVESPEIHDSGTNGFDVVYEAAPGAHPLLSGGRRITGWVRSDAVKNIYQASVGDLQTRELFVNGVRAVRTHGAVNPPGWEKTATGWRAPDEAMARWRNLKDVELLSLWWWKAFRCPIESVAGRDVRLQEPCATYANQGYFRMRRVTWVENAYELLGTPGQFYLDRAAGQLYYVPRPGEDMNTAVVVAPVAEALVRGAGTRQTPLRHVVFRGITFSHTTFLFPNTSYGYVGDGAGMHPTPQGWVMTPSAVTFAYSQYLTFDRNTFRRTGAGALALTSAARNNRVTGNVFVDTGHSAVQLGDVTDNAEPDPTQHTIDNVVSNNFVRLTGAQYPNAVGIWVGYAANTRIVNNDLAELSHNGIAVGWGWATESYARDNQIVGNSIRRVGRVLWDVGGVYTLNRQPGTTITRNLVDGVGHDDFQVNNGIYLDEWTAEVQVHANAVLNAHNWLSIWNVTQHNNVVTFNVADLDRAQCPVNRFEATELCNVNGNVVRDNILGPPPLRAGGDGFGLERDYRDIAVPVNEPLSWDANGPVSWRPAGPMPDPESSACRKMSCSLLKSRGNGHQRSLEATRPHPGSGHRTLRISEADRSCPPQGLGCSLAALGGKHPLHRHSLATLR